jgi:hypothetical protein
MVSSSFPGHHFRENPPKPSSRTKKTEKSMRGKKEKTERTPFFHLSQQPYRPFTIPNASRPKLFFFSFSSPSSGDFERHAQKKKKKNRTTLMLHDIPAAILSDRRCDEFHASHVA